MAALDNQPTNVNFLAPTNFRFFIKKSPNVNFFIQKATIPSVTLGSISQPTPLISIPQPSDQLQYSPLSITFIVDEDLRNYLEIYDWLLGLGFPETSTQYANLQSKSRISGEGIISDISVNVLNSAKNPNFEFIFMDAFPIQLGSLNFSVTETGIEYLTVDATFDYRSFTINRF